MTKLTQEQLSQIVIDAQEAAAQAANEYLTQNPDAWYPCGFSWVRIKPARGPLVSFLKKNNIGHVDSYMGGWLVYNPSKNHTQCMDAKIAGSRAFVEVIKKHMPDIKIKVESRID